MPEFKIRGVIEGFYGKPWTHHERTDMIDFISKAGMNTYFLAPKDEPGHRRHWQDLRPESEFVGLKELVSLATSKGITFGTAVSPGQTIRYSDPKELEALKGRLKQYLDVGISLVGVFLDDIPHEFQTESDSQAFASFAHAHSYIGNEIHEWLKKEYPSAQLVICPTVYRGTGRESYVLTLGELLNPEIHLFWTGIQICSYRLDVRDAQIFTESAKRQPLFWDNYPVNDVAMIHELHIGPLRAREPELVNYSEGLLANPMWLAESSKIPLWTIGEYLGDPHNYNPDTAWERALEQVIKNAEDRAAYRQFARTSLGSCLNDDSAPDFSATLSEIAFMYRNQSMQAAVQKLQTLATEISRSSARIQLPTFSNLKLAQEATPWIRDFQRGGQILELLSENLRSGGNREYVQKLAVEVLSWRSRIFGDALAMFLTELADDLLSP